MRHVEGSGRAKGLQTPQDAIRVYVNYVPPELDIWDRP